ncbi:MAG TPA: ArsR family transcriptional regulator [Candidatus Methanofastidiosa archaeon]|nr:ArsR family transcriptional regulator [Candidatus Methanofastidiosa archaeon]
MYAKVLEVLMEAEEPLTKEEVAKRANVTVAKTSLNLLRLREEGKVESKEMEGSICWSIKKEDDGEKKLRQRAGFKD